MTRNLLYLLSTLLLSQLPMAVGASQAFDTGFAPRHYVIEKLKTHDMVFMGTTHQQPRILQFIGALLPDLHAAGVTHVALEIASDQQERIQQFLTNGAGLDEIELHAAIACPAYRHLLQLISAIPKPSRPHIRAVDLPAAHYGGPMNRDQWIARELAAIFRNQEDAKVLVIIGTLHVLRKLDWHSPHQQEHVAIRTHLSALRPQRSLFSIVNLVSDIENDCDFSRTFGGRSGIQALDLEPRFQKWQLGFTRWMAIRPAPPHELVDGIIVY